MTQDNISISLKKNREEARMKSILISNSIFYAFYKIIDIYIYKETKNLISLPASTDYLNPKYIL